MQDKYISLFTNFLRRKYGLPFLIIGCLLAVQGLNSKTSGKTGTKAKRIAASDSLDIIPRPVSVNRIQSDPFSITRDTKIRFVKGDKNAREAGRRLAEALEEITGLSLQTEAKSKSSKSSNEILLTSEPSNKEIPKEGYRLEVRSGQIKLNAPDAAGLYYGIQTLKQLLPVRVDSREATDWNVSAAVITDYPRFSWRGMHLDVSRHFFSEETVKEFIDYLAFYKLNRLHLHLTDDQGWRLQIKKYPKLTEEGAWRTFNDQDSVAIERAKTDPDFELPQKHIRHREGQKEYGGFYTSEQMKSIIEYAQARHVTIIPEIDMPGHLMSAIQSYPELSCTGKADWGETFSVPACPCKESTFQFLQNVLDEVVDLFPGEYIHIGADEVEKTTWKQSGDCRQLMKEKSLESVEEVQSYFVDRMARYLQAKGKKVIGWDEIIEGGIPDNMIMMYWRNWMPKALKLAAQNGNNIIMATSSIYYFNAEQTPESLRDVYHSEPVPDFFTDEQDSLVLGAQGNLWTEWIPSKERLYYMAMPRMLALSEVVWSPKKDLSWRGFTDRIQPHYTRLDMKGVNYRQPDLKGFHTRNVFTDSIEVSFTAPREDIEIYYTTDGSEPTKDSKKYTGPFTLTQTTAFRLKTILPTGAPGESYKTRYVQQDLQPAAQLTDPKPGVRMQYTDKAYHSVEDFNFQEDESVQEVITRSFEVPDSIAQKPTFGVEYHGYIDVPADGVYTFYTSTDDGSKLFVDGQLVVDNDEPHSEIEKSTAQIALKAGFHPINLKFFELGGGHALNVYYEGPGISKQRIPADLLFHEE